MSIFNSNNNEEHSEWRDNLIKYYSNIIKNMADLRDTLSDAKRTKELPSHESAIIKYNNNIIKELYKALYDAE